MVEKFVIIDCRYPYEFKGGHIQGALNIYTQKGIYEEFLKSDEHRKKSASNKRTILIFHCEFSSERGPKMSRFLRKNDREANKECYPSLHYPELYLLEGGYKAFYHDFKVRRYFLSIKIDRKVWSLRLEVSEYSYSAWDFSEY